MTKKTGIASIDADTEKLEKLEARSAKATGLVGKLFSLPHADGAAIYTVEEEKGSKVRIVNQPIHDAWQDDVLGAGGWFPRKQIEPIIRRQESFSKAMDSAAKRQKSDREKYAELVGAAALADLGAKADVYALASWAWKRSFRGGTKDARILKEGARLPWANDIASGLIDSGCFEAIEALKKDSVVFIMLSDKFSDPIIYRNAPPSAFAVLGAVEDAFKKAVGVVPNGLGVTRSESKYLDNTRLDVLNPEGVKVASVCYDAADGKILQVSVAFQVDEKGVRSE
jgi:hypothetical protein